LRQHDASALAGSHWNGRFALTVQSEPAQSTAASFELSGSPSQGELQLFSPLGTTLAVLTWTPTKATLSQPSLEQTSGSLDDLVAQATGTEIPVRALFDWLNGIPTEVPGWRVDLTQLPEGRLQVRRLTPTPTVDLRLKVQQ
jgi:outer membrane lipoprotein LolB